MQSREHEPSVDARGLGVSDCRSLVRRKGGQRAPRFFSTFISRRVGRPIVRVLFIVGLRRESGRRRVYRSLSIRFPGGDASHASLSHAFVVVVMAGGWWPSGAAIARKMSCCRH